MHNYILGHANIQVVYSGLTEPSEPLNIKAAINQIKEIIQRKSGLKCLPFHIKYTPKG